MKTINPINLAEVQEAGKKRALRRVEEREHLRLEIEARKNINAMQAGIDTLFQGYEESPFDKGLLVPLGRDRIAAIKAGCDVAARLLNKVLPDLRQVEMKQHDSDTEGMVLQDIDLANRLRLYTESKRKRGTEIAVFSDVEITDVECTDDLDFLN